MSTVEDLEAEIAQLKLRIMILEGGIRQHKEKTGNASCWENDVELWGLVEEGSDYSEHRDTLPPKEEFLSRCSEYYEARLCPKDVPVVFNLSKKV